MNYLLNRCSPIILAVALLVCFPADPFALTADDILKKVLEQNWADGFRMSLHVETAKGSKKILKHALWLMGKANEEQGEFFVEFEAPEESKGIRYLFRLEAEQGAKAHMYLPATGKVLPVASDDADTEIGGTGLTVSDIQSLAPRGGQTSTILREEKVDGRDCYVVQTTPKGGNAPAVLWILKQEFQVLKSELLGKDGKPKRLFHVVEFFTTDKGKTFPREETVTIPAKQVRIKIRQENAVFGIDVPRELLDAKTFGQFKWTI